MATLYGDYEPVIGLEVHAQLLTRTKAFCGCATSFGDPPNTHTCPVCLGLPGALPVLSEEAVRMAASAALALGCMLSPRSIFARKNYFYPDLPKGYQISQYEEPLATHGAVDVETEDGKRKARILRVHMEEDAGKNVHGVGDESVVDLNRAGTPLIEIVGEPDLRSGAEAADYLKRLREILMFIGVNDGNLEQGSFRCDANVSVRKVGETALGTRTELKNINSFRFVADAIDVEARRQVALLERGERVRQQTRGYNADKRETYLLRDKENESGYRYFPEPDLPPLVLDSSFIDDVRRTLPHGPVARRRHLVDVLGLTPQAAAVLTSHPQITHFYETTLALYVGAAGSSPDARYEGGLTGPAQRSASRSDAHTLGAVKAANFIQSEMLRDVRSSGLLADFPVSPGQVAELLRLVDRGAISGKQAKEVYALMRGTAALPSAIVRERNMSVISDEVQLVVLAREIVAQNAKQAESYRAGKVNLLGFFVGLMMKHTSGSADPGVVNRVLKRVLAGEAEVGEAERPAMTPENTGVAGPFQPPALRESEGRPRREAGAEVRSPGRPGLIMPIAPTPRSGLRDREGESPLAQSVLPPPLEHTTLTSASGAAAVMIPGPPGAPSTEGLTPEAFARFDLRIGRVVSAARVPRKDKLLDLSVDAGDVRGPRRIIAGLALSFAPEELVGKRVLVVCNIEPRDFGRGYVSEGMILATGPAEGLALATVNQEIPPGTRVK
jgi:aspartyl-tRNA(Asn)/glutamyl-tRNA(Gln) amidotransferase subunit B